VTVNAAAPGFVRTEFNRNATGVTARLDRLDTRPALRRVVDAGRAYAGIAQGSYFQEMAAVDHIDTDTKVSSVPESTAFHDVTDGVGHVTINGNRIKMPEGGRSRVAGRERRNILPGR
jgi:hypothetical protein